jgi:hypothetical protein
MRRQLQVGTFAQAGYGPNDEVERRKVALPINGAALFQSSTPPWFTEDAAAALARTDC